MFTFEPMRIRQFDIEYNKVENKQKLSTSKNQKDVAGLNDDDDEEDADVAISEEDDSSVAMALQSS